MKLAELFKKHDIRPDFNSFLRRSLRPGMPPLNIGKLAMHILVGNKAGLSTPAPANADASMLLAYKGKEGAVLSIAEQADGDVWFIPQVQGAKSRKSYRVASGMHWAACLGTQTKSFAHLPQAEVKHVTMPRLCDIENITHSAAIESVGAHYAAVRGCFGMRWSQEHGLFIADILRKS